MSVEKDFGVFEDLDSQFQYAAAHDSWSPDEALDLIFMMQPKDWIALSELWNKRDTEWKRVCAYIVGMGPVEGQNLSKQALLDENLEVVTEAAIGLSRLKRRNFDEVVLSQEDIWRLKQVVQWNLENYIEEVQQLLDTLSNAVLEN